MSAGPLIGPADLAGRLERGEAVTVLDVRWRLGGPPARADFDAGHLPGAVFVDLDRDLAGPPGAGGRHPLPDPARFGATMRAAGVRTPVPVVCYDDRDATSAARAWWLLRFHGHPSVSVLDGGLAGWCASGGPLITEARRPDPGDFVPRPGHLGLAGADGAAAAARHGVLLDARAAERYRGETEPVDPVAGHIPGAVSAPTALNVDGAGRFRSPEQLRRRFEQLGPVGAGPVVAYCGSGVTAAHQVLALALAGIEAGLYAGSWSEWITDPGRPVATGDN